MWGTEGDWRVKGVAIQQVMEYMSFLWYMVGKFFFPPMSENGPSWDGVHYIFKSMSPLELLLNPETGRREWDRIAYLTENALSWLDNENTHANILLESERKFADAKAQLNEQINVLVNEKRSMRAEADTLRTRVANAKKKQTDFANEIVKLKAKLSRHYH